MPVGETIHCFVPDEVEYALRIASAAGEVRMVQLTPARPLPEVPVW
jgi:hypothetical protein